MKHGAAEQQRNQVVTETPDSIELSERVFQIFYMDPFFDFS